MTGLGHSVEGTRQTCVLPQEHVIHVWEETGSRFHNCLIQLYCEKVQGLMKAYLLSFPAGTSSIESHVAPGLRGKWGPEGAACDVGKQNSLWWAPGGQEVPQRSQGS